MQIDQRRARQQYQNKVNNAQGHFFEDYIKAACALYSMRERAERKRRIGRLCFIVCILVLRKNTDTK